MQFRDLFDENLNPKWDYIWTLEPFKACIGVHQSKEWHREMLEEHIQSVTEHMHDFCDFGGDDITERRRLMLMSAALCHDLGKAVTTKWDEGLKQWKCKNHGAVGEKIVRKFFFDESDVWLREKVCWLTRYHMVLHNLKDKEDDVIEKKIEQLSFKWDGIEFDDIAALYVCDCMGCENSFNDGTDNLDDMEFTKKCLKIYQEKFSKKPELHIGNPTAIVLVGLPGSGKSTFASYGFNEGYKVISRDSIREELGMTSSDKKFKGTKEQEDKVTKVFNERLLTYARNNVPFIIDNTNLLERYRTGYKELLKDYDIQWECVYIEAPTLEICKKRREGFMPTSEIDKMLDRFEFPRPYEFDNFVIYKQVQE